MKSSSPHPHIRVIENKEQKDETDGSDSDRCVDIIKKSPDDNRRDCSLPQQDQDLMPKCSLKSPGLKWEDSVPVQCTEDRCQRDTEINVCKDKARAPQRLKVHACFQDDSHQRNAEIGICKDKAEAPHACFQDDSHQRNAEINIGKGKAVAPQRSKEHACIQNDSHQRNAEIDICKDKAEAPHACFQDDSHQRNAEIGICKDKAQAPHACVQDDSHQRNTEINIGKGKAVAPRGSQVDAYVQDDIDLPHSISETPLSEESDRHPDKGPRMKLKEDCIDDTRKKKIADEEELSLKYITAGESTSRKLVKPVPVGSADLSVLNIMPFLKPVSRNQMCLFVYMLRGFSPQPSSPTNELFKLDGSSSSNYNSDLTRLATFFGYPPDIKTFAIVLSRDGFIFLQSEDSIECYSCKLRISLSELRKPDADPVKMHGDRSPQCPLKQRERSVNAAATSQMMKESGSPSHSTINPSSGPNPSSVLNGARGSGPYQEDRSAVPSSPVQSPPTLNTTLDSISRTPQEQVPRVIDGSIQHLGSTDSTAASLQRSESAAAAVETTDSSSSRASTDRSRSSGSPPSSRQQQAASRAASDQAGAPASAAGNQTRNPKATKKTKAMKRAEAAARQASANSGSGTMGAAQTSGKKGEQGKEKKKLTYGDLGIFADKPKRPDMASLRKRMTSYDGKWQDSFAKTPQTLAECGMYYAGYSDCARCFFCAGGLKNWEPGDEPWVEHARWFPKCPYLLLCKGQPFVDIVQRKNDRSEKIIMKDVEEEIKQKTRSLEEASFKSLPGSSSGREPRQRRSDSTCKSSKSILQVLKELERENEDLNADLACKICMDEKSTVVFLPCGHMVACTDCAVVLKSCPLCRADIRGTVKAQLEC